MSIIDQITDQFGMTQQEELTIRKQLSEMSREHLVETLIFQMQCCNEVRNRLIEAENRLSVCKLVNCEIERDLP